MQLVLGVNGEDFNRVYNNVDKIYVLGGELSIFWNLDPLSDSKSFSITLERVRLLQVLSENYENKQ